MKQVIQRRGQEYDGGGAVQQAAEGNLLSPKQERRRPPTVRIFQRKSSEYERRETQHHAPVRDAEPNVHSKEVFLAVVEAESRPVGGAAMAAQLRKPVEQVVQQHEAQGRRNDREVKPANPSNNGVRCC